MWFLCLICSIKYLLYLLFLDINIIVIYTILSTYCIYLNLHYIRASKSNCVFYNINKKRKDI